MVEVDEKKIDKEGLLVLDERSSYYRMMRQTIRIGNHFGFLSNNVLATRFANSGFPKGYGPEKNKNGIPLESFRHRVIFISILYFFLIVAVVYNDGFKNITIALSVFALVVEIISIPVLFWRDKITIENQVKDEQGLFGTDPNWY